MRILLEDYELIYSRLASTLNTPFLLSADYKRGKFLSFQPPTPQVGKLKSPEIGGGTEFGAKPRNGIWPPMEIPLSGWLNTEISAHMAARAFGGTVTNTPVTAGASFDHIVPLQTKAQGRTPKLTDLAITNAGDDFLHASMAVNVWEARFGGADPPQWSASLINTGYSWLRLQDIDPAIVAAALETYHYFHPVAVEATFNDGTAINFAQDGRLISGACGINNQIVVRSQPGDPFRVAGDRSSGSYSRDIHRGKRVYTPTLKVSMDEEYSEFVRSRDNTDITSLKYKYVGDPIGATPENHELEITYPLSTVTVAADPDDINAGLALSFDIDREEAVGGVAILRVRNGVATLA